MTDPDGRDFNIRVTHNKNGDINGVIISSTVLIRGAGASKPRAGALTDYAASVLKPWTTTNGVTVSFDVQYKLDERGPQDKLGAGENVLDFNSTPEQSTENPDNSRSEAHGIETVSAGGSRYTVANNGTVYGSGADSRTVLHETMHMMGLSDRYDNGETSYGVPYPIIHAGFPNNIMGDGNTLNKFQYQQYALFGRFVPSIYHQDTAPGFNRFVDRKLGFAAPRTPFHGPGDKGGFHVDPDPVNNQR